MSCRNSSRLMIVLASALGAAIGVSALPAKLYAADLDSTDFGEPPAPPQPVEFGTGWYIRGDAAFAMDSLPEISPLGFFPDNSGLRNTYSLGFGGGYKFNNWFRTDVTLDYRDHLSASDSTHIHLCQWHPLGCACQRLCRFRQLVRLERFFALCRRRRRRRLGVCKDLHQGPNHLLHGARNGDLL